MKLASLSLALIVVAGGCSHDPTPFPSLGKRPVEAMDFSEPPAAPETPVVADPRLDGQIAALDTRLKAATAGFDADAAKAERAARMRNAKTVGSDAWLDAQTLLASLDARRAVTTEVAADVAALDSARAATLAPPYPAIVALQGRVEAEVARQSTAIGRIQALLPDA